MRYLLNAVYLLVLVILFPWLLYKAITTGKYRTGLLEKFFGVVPRLPASKPVVWFHGVSVGEILMLRRIVKAFAERWPHYQIVVSTTTVTGMAEARKHLSHCVTCYWPLDFSWAINRGLRRLHPHLIVLAESEIWPNFLINAKRRGVPIAVINGRMSPRSGQRYQQWAWLTKPLLKRIDLFAMQTEEYAQQIRALDIPSVYVTGNIKYDGVESKRGNARTVNMAKIFHLKPEDKVWIVGSTQAPEEAMALRIFQKLRQNIVNLKLIIVPRQKERFGEVAGLIKNANIPFQRRSDIRPDMEITASVILVDTIGELAAVWGLADVAFVGGSFDGQRGGQNMIEPAAFGAAVTFGPMTWNFRDTVTRLLEKNAAVAVQNEQHWYETTLELLQNIEKRQEMGQRACQFVQTQQGATRKTLELLDSFLQSSSKEQAA